MGFRLVPKLKYAVRLVRLPLLYFIFMRIVLMGMKCDDDDDDGDVEGYLGIHRRRET